MPRARLCHRACGRPPCSRPLDSMPTSSYSMPALHARTATATKRHAPSTHMPCLLPRALPICVATHTCPGRPARARSTRCTRAPRRPCTPHPHLTPASPARTLGHRHHCSIRPNDARLDVRSPRTLLARWNLTHPCVPRATQGPNPPCPHRLFASAVPVAPKVH